MDHSQSPRRYHNAGGQVSYYPPLSDEARFLQRLAEPNAEAEVEAAVDELGGHWADAYQLLRPDRQPARTDMCDRCGLHPTCGMSVSSNGSWPPTHLCRPCYDAETQPQQPHAFTGQGNRLGE